MPKYKSKLVKRKKWRYLTVSSKYDKVRVPIFKAAGHKCKVPLLKTMMSNKCSNDCKFCPFRAERSVRRERWNPAQLANVTLKVWKRRQISGLFLSSSVDKEPDKMVEEQLETSRILRNRGFTGYIHLKLMPGTDYSLIKESVQLADRVGINLEFPSSGHYNDMKLFLDFKQDIIKRMRLLSREIKKAQEEGKCKAGLDSQMVLGASNEKDREVIDILEWLYNKMGAQRVYFSAFNPIKGTPMEKNKAENPWREYRMYQSSFLIQRYGFKKTDFVVDDYGMLNLKEDPKFTYAKANDICVNVNSAGFEDLIKVPGIGIKTAKTIEEAKSNGTRFKDLKDLKGYGVILKRATPFIDIGVRQTRLSSFIN